MALLDAGDARICAVNKAEVIAKLVDRGLSADDAVEAWAHLPLAVEPLTAATALAAGLLRKTTRTLGLSLGDRCCLAFAQQVNADVVTADKAWKSLKGFRVKLIR